MAITCVFLKIKTRIKTSYNNIDCDSVLPKFFSLNFILNLLAVNSSEGPSFILLHDNMGWVGVNELIKMSKTCSGSSQKFVLIESS